MVGGSFGPTRYAINAYNGGRRPVTLTVAGFDLSHDTTLPILTFQTTRLEDGEAVDAYIDIGEAPHLHPETKWLESWARH